MGKVITGASMSLDGFIAGPGGTTGFDYLFAWHNSGDVEIPSADPRITFNVSEASAAHVRGWMDVGAIVVGRRLFDITQGWGGRHPLDAPVFVVTHSVPKDWPHPDAPFTFVTDGVESAVRQAKEIAGDQIVSVAAGDIGRQCLDLGLVDELSVDLVPVLLGEGVRFVDDLAKPPITLGTPRVIEADGVTHLTYPVHKP